MDKNSIDDENTLAGSLEWYLQNESPCMELSCVCVSGGGGTREVVALAKANVPSFFFLCKTRHDSVKMENI